VMRRFGTEQVHVILVKDQIALTEDDVTMDRRDAERILVVNLQQSCFRLCQNSESVPGAAQENYIPNTVLAARLSPHPLGSGVGRLRHSMERDDQSRTLGCDSMVADSTAAID